MGTSAVADAVTCLWWDDCHGQHCLLGVMVSKSDCLVHAWCYACVSLHCSVVCRADCQSTGWQEQAGSTAGDEENSTSVHCQLTCMAYRLASDTGL